MVTDMPVLSTEGRLRSSPILGLDPGRSGANVIDFGCLQYGVGSAPANRFVHSPKKQTDTISGFVGGNFQEFCPIARISTFLIIDRRCTG